MLTLLWVLLAVAIAAPPAFVVLSEPAHAQLFKRKAAEGEEKPKERRGFFQRLFGIGKQEEAQEKPAPRSTAKRSTGGGAAGGNAAAAGAVAAPPREPAVEKLENARVVLVVGDFLASGLGEGLTEAFEQSPGVRVVTRADGSSGFVRDDHFDWPGRIGQIVSEEKPAAVIVVIGSNDRQQMLVNGTREKPRTDAWNAEYRARAKAMADAVRGAGVPLLWMGAPSFKTGAMSTDMIAFNDIYRDVVGQAGGEFIDIWDGFVDENGAFMPVGPDMNGQRVRLRGSDGINMTAAGKRKMAFYAERPLNRILGSATSPSVAPTLLEGTPTVQPLDPREIERTAPIALADPQLDGGGAHLLGASKQPQPEKARMPVERLTRDGIAAEGRTGRADDFMIQSVAAQAQPAVQAEPLPLGEPLAASPETTGTIPN